MTRSIVTNERDLKELASDGKPAKRVVIKNDSSNPVPVELAPSSQERITNLNLTASVEGSHSFVTNGRKALIRNRNDFDLKFSFSNGTTLTNYITLKAGAVLFLEGVDFSGKTLYLIADSNCTVEILEFYL